MSNRAIHSVSANPVCIEKVSWTAGSRRFPFAQVWGRLRPLLCAFGMSWALVGTAGRADASAQRRIEIQIDRGSFQGEGTWPLGLGVPFPRGQMRDIGRLRLVDGQNRRLPFQAEVRTKWPDGSIKWTWVDFQGDPNDRYLLEMKRRPAPTPRPGAAVTVSQTAHTLDVDTGRMRVSWDTRFGTPVKIQIGNSVSIAEDGRGTFVIDNQGRKAVFGGEKAELEWKVEAAGPIRAVVRAEGWYVTAEGDRLARAVVRYHLYGGRTFFFVDHTFVLTEDTDKLWFKEVAVRFPWKATRGYNARFGVKDGQDVVADIPNGKNSAWIFQDDYPHFAQTRTHFAVGMSSPRGTRILKDGKTAAGWCNATDGISGITLAVRDFAPQFPKELLVQADGATARLWSSRGGKELDYRPATLVRDYYGEDWIGQLRKEKVHGEGARMTVDQFKRLKRTGLGSARTHMIFCGYYGGRTESSLAAGWAATFERPPVALADPAWLCRSGVFWPVAPKDANRFPEAERFITDYFDNWLGRMQHFPMTGWINYGVGPELAYETRNGKRYASFYRLNNVAAYNTPKNVWVAYLRSGDRKFGEWVERYTRFLSDFKVLHWGGGWQKKKKGLLCVGLDGQLPLYWTSSGSWDTVGQSTEYLVPFRIGYFLRDLRWARDTLELYGEAANRSWNIETIRRLGSWSSRFCHWSMLMNVYRVTQDPELAKKIHMLGDGLIDLNERFGLSVTFSKSKPIRDWTLQRTATYKYGRKVNAILDYYDLFGVDKAKQAVLKANEELFGSACSRPPLSYQNFAPVFLSRCFVWTGNPGYRDAALAHMESAIRWFKEYEALPEKERWRHQGKFTPDKQGFPFFAVPHVLSLLAGKSEDDLDVFPYLANMGPDYECPIHVRKRAGKSVVLAVLTIRHRGERGDVSIHVAGPRGEPIPDAEVGRAPSGAYTITIPAHNPAGVYHIAPGPARYLVVGCNADKLVLSFPRGTYFGHRSGLGFAFVRGKRYFFDVPQGQETFSIRVSRPIQVFDPSGKRVEGLDKRTGRLTVTTAGRPGLWSFLPGGAGFLRFEDIAPVVAFGDPGRFFLPPGVPKAVPERKWTSPGAGRVGGRFGNGLHINGKTYRARLNGTIERSEFPFPEGTIEFFVRTDWSSRWLPERSIKSFWTAGPFFLGYRHNIDRDDRNMFLTWLQFHPAGSKGKGWRVRAGVYTAFEAGEWNHVACTWRTDAPEYVVYLNGEKRALVAEPIPRTEPDGTLSLGPLAGTYDELRVSRVVRYDEDFEPPTKPFASDKDTALLFHFDSDLRSVGRRGTVEFARQP